VVTGWYAEFDALQKSGRTDVAYADGDGRFAGATYDPTSHYRAAAVLDFHMECGLEPALLRQVSQHQVGLIAAEFVALEPDPGVITRDRSVGLESIGGFVAFECPSAGSFVTALRERGVMCDSRGTILRFGPAPYLSDRQIRDAVLALGEVARTVR
jgi:kynureninase